MKYEKTLKYNTDLINQKIMGPNPLKLEEELMKDNKIKAGSIVMDLGSGQGCSLSQMLSWRISCCGHSANRHNSCICIVWCLAPTARHRYMLH